MKKKVLAAVLSMVMAAACMTACGDSTSTADADPSSKADSSSSVSESSSAASESTDDSSASSSESESKADSSASDSSSSSDSSKTEEKQEEKEVLIKEEQYSSDKQLTNYTTYTYEYDEAAGHYIRNAMHATSSVSDHGKMDPEKTWGKDEYDKDMTLLARYGKTGKQTYKYEYDENGHRIKETRIDEKSGKVLESAKYEYDADGNCVKTLMYNNDVEVDVTITREFSGDKKVREKFESKTGGYDNVFTYNEKGDLIRTDTNPPSKTTYDEYSYEYFDDGGYKKTLKRFENGKNTDTQTDTFDSHGNHTIHEVVNGVTIKYYYGKLPK